MCSSDLGGLPIAAYGGRADLMRRIAPVGPVYQAGTLSGNPVAVSAGIAMLRYIEDHPEIYHALERITGEVVADLPAGLCVNRIGSMFTIFFQPGPVKNFEDVKRSDMSRFGRFFHALLDHGVYFPPSQFEAAFVSVAHTPEDITATRAAVREALA